MVIRATPQLEFPIASNGGSGLPDAFKRLYFHLYTNSKASRAERIVEDLALILFARLAAEELDGSAAVTRFLKGEAAEESLLPLLRDAYPGLLAPGQGFNIGEDPLRSSFKFLDDVSLSQAPAHVLGEAFQALMGPRLRGDKGQFFTPRSLVRAMVEVVAPKGHESVVDPACGTGGFLLEAHAFQNSAGRADATGRLLGVDKDADLARLASALLRVASRKRAQIENSNSLDPRTWEQETGFDVVLTNPPFGAKIGIRDRGLLADYALGHYWRQELETGNWERTNSLLAQQDPQTLFLERCVRLLRPGGRMGIVLPEGIFGNKKTGFVWEWLRSEGEIFGLLDCPRTTFQPGTDTKTNVLFFRKKPARRKKPTGGGPVRVAVALHCGHDRRGRTQLSDGTPFPDDFSRLGSSFHDPRSTLWQAVDVHRPNYLVPRYYVRQGTAALWESQLIEGAEVVSLGELIASKRLTILKGHEVGSQEYGSGDVPFIRTSDISNFEISVDPTNSVSDDVYRRYARQQRLRPGNILMVVDGRYRIGACAMVTARTSRCVVQSHLRIIAVRQSDRLDPYALLFALTLPSIRTRIRNLVFVQSTLGTLGDRILELEVPLLSGSGPWSEAVANFRHVLSERDRLFGLMSQFDGTEVEL